LDASWQTGEYLTPAQLQSALQVAVKFILRTSKMPDARLDHRKISFFDRITGNKFTPSVKMKRRRETIDEHKRYQ